MHVLFHALKDTLRLMPFIFLIYFVIEYLEHRHNTRLSHHLMKAKKSGPLYGAILGSIPQCGFSVIAADLYSRRAISVGSLVAIFIATSDEAVPLIIAMPSKAGFALGLIAAKLVLAIVWGFVLDALVPRRREESICTKKHRHNHFHGNCESCDRGIFLSTLIHTLKLFAFIFAANLVMGYALDTIGKQTLGEYLMKGSILAPFVASLVGLIPNCAASVILTTVFLNDAMSFGTLVAGLTTGAGVGILVLIRRNKSLGESLGILGILYGSGVVSGIFVDFITGLFL